MNTCKDCGLFVFEGVGANGLCEGCQRDGRETCGKCAGMVSPGALLDGLCTDCFDGGLVPREAEPWEMGT